MMRPVVAPYMLGYIQEKDFQVREGRRDAAGLRACSCARLRHRLLLTSFLGRLGLLAVFTLVGVFVVPPVAKSIGQGVSEQSSPSSSSKRHRPQTPSQ
jgi:hypothetical protein